MTFTVGGVGVTAVHVGSVDAVAVYAGDVKVWPDRTLVFDYIDHADVPPGATSASWRNGSLAPITLTQSDANGFTWATQTVGGDMSPVRGIFLVAKAVKLGSGDPREYAKLDWGAGWRVILMRYWVITGAGSYSHKLEVDSPRAQIRDSDFYADPGDTGLWGGAVVGQDQVAFAAPTSASKPKIVSRTGWSHGGTPTLTLTQGEPEFVVQRIVLLGDMPTIADVNQWQHDYNVTPDRP